MKEVIQKLNELAVIEREGQNESNTNFADLMVGFKIGLDSIQKAIISTSAASDAQRLSLAMRAEKLAKAEARRRALAEKEARQEADDMRKAQLAGGGEATGIDLSSFLEEDGKGFVGTIIASITGLVASIAAAMGVAGLTFKQALKQVLGKRLDKLKAAILKPFTTIKNFFGKIGKFFKNFGSKLGKLFKSGGLISKAGGIFKKVFGVIGKLGGVLGRLFAPLGVILGAFAGIFDAVKAFQNEEGDLLDKIVAGIKGFFQGFVGFAIGGLLDLGKDLLAWLLGVFGVPEEKLEGMKNFSVTDFLKDLIGNIFDGIDAFFTSLFDGMFEGFNNTEGNIFQKILGGIMGLITGWADGLLEGYSKVIDGIASFFGNDEFSFKDWITGLATDIWNGITGFFRNIFEKGKEAAGEFIMANIALGQWIAGYAKDIWGSITGFFASIIDTAKEGIASIGEGMINIGDTIKSFIRDMLPDPDGKGFFGLAGKLLRKTGIYDFVDADTPTEADTPTFVDTTAIIPPKSSVGEALTQVGSMTGGGSVTVVNNNGGNVTNTTTSNQTNNTSTASPPVLSGSALAM